MIRYFNLLKNIENWWVHFAIKFGLTGSDPVVFNARNGIVIEVPRRLIHEFKEIFMEECYTKGLHAPVREKAVIIDMGANAGFFSLFAASRFRNPRIFSYEPIESNFHQLGRNRSLNKNINILCFQKAVYGRSGWITLHFNPNDSFSTSATVFDASEISEDTVKVPCVTLQEILDENDIRQCDLLKIDCEGAEYEILYRCPEPYLCRISQMVIEVHQGMDANQNIRSLEDYLKTKNFNTHCYGRHMLWACQQTHK